MAVIPTLVEMTFAEACELATEINNLDAWIVLAILQRLDKSGPIISAAHNMGAHAMITCRDDWEQARATVEASRLTYAH